MENDPYGYKEFPCTCNDRELTDCNGCLQWSSRMYREFIDDLLIQED